MAFIYVYNNADEQVNDQPHVSVTFLFKIDVCVLLNPVKPLLSKPTADELRQSLEFCGCFSLKS